MPGQMLRVIGIFCAVFKRKDQPEGSLDVLRDSRAFCDRGIGAVVWRLEKDRLRMSKDPSFDITTRIADHPRDRKIDIVVLRRLKQKAGLRLTTVAQVCLGMGTRIDPCDLRVLRLELGMLAVKKFLRDLHAR